MRKFYITFSLLGLLLVSCEDWIQGPEDEPQNGGQSNMSARFSDIQTEVFSKSCATSGCHNGTQDPNLSAGEAYNNLVNQASAQVPSMLRVKPGDSNNSYLMKKLTQIGIRSFRACHMGIMFRRVSGARPNASWVIVPCGSQPTRMDEL